MAVGGRNERSFGLHRDRIDGGPHTSRLEPREFGRYADQCCRGDGDPGVYLEVENGHTRVSWERLAFFCEQLNCSPSQVVRLAEFLSEQKSRPESDVVADLLQDLERHLNGGTSSV